MSFLVSLAENGCLSASVERAVQMISQGHVIALPTDTVYGLAAAAQNTEAVNRLYKIKGRDKKKPFAICVHDVKSISNWGKLDNIPSSLLNALLPGPVTILLERTSNLNPALNPEFSTVGVRIPDNKFVIDLCKKLGTPLALTSANASYEPSTLAPEEFKSLWPQLAAVFHIGRIADDAAARAGSTIVDLSIPGKYQIHRPGIALENTMHILEEFGVIEKEQLDRVCS